MSNALVFFRFLIFSFLARLKLIGKNLLHIKKVHSSLDTKTKNDSPCKCTKPKVPGMMKILEKYEILEVLGKVKFIFWLKF